MVAIIIRGFADDEGGGIGEGNLSCGSLWDILEFKVGGKSIALALI